MALPGNTLSTSNAVLQFEPPRDVAKLPLEDWERGGVAIGDSSQGLNVYDWRCFVDGNDIKVEVPEVIPPVTIHTRSNIEEISFTFDQAMRPFFTWQLLDGTCQFRWFDPIAQQFVVTGLPAGSRTPRCALDDKRITQTQASDIILAYMNGTELRYRQQRDRYEVERVLRNDLGTRSLLQIGMSRAYRFQFRLRG